MCGVVSLCDGSTDAAACSGSGMWWCSTEYRVVKGRDRKGVNDSHSVVELSEAVAA